MVFEGMADSEGLRFTSIPKLGIPDEITRWHQLYFSQPNSQQVLWDSHLICVQSVRRSTDGKPCMVKMQKKENSGEIQIVKNLNREIKILHVLSHELVVPLVDCWQEPEYVCMVFELFRQDLYSWSEGFGHGAPAPFVEQIFSSMIEVFHYIHSQGIAHRGIQLENILLSGDGFIGNKFRVHITGFGMSIFSSELDQHGKTQGICGSPFFHAPEMLENRLYDPFVADLWSIGCVILELVIGHIEFNRSWPPIYQDSASSFSQFCEAAVLAKESCLGDLINDKSHEGLEDLQLVPLLFELLNLDADQRITSEQLKAYVQDSSDDAITREGASVSHPADGRESRTTWEVCRSPATMADEEAEEVPTSFWDLDDDLLEDNEDPRCLAPQ